MLFVLLHTESVECNFSLTYTPLACGPAAGGNSGASVFSAGSGELGKEMKEGSFLGSELDEPSSASVDSADGHLPSSDLRRQIKNTK